MSIQYVGKLVVALSFMFHKCATDVTIKDKDEVKNESAKVGCD